MTDSFMLCLVGKRSFQFKFTDSGPLTTSRSNTYEKLTGHVLGSRVNAKEILLCFWSLRRQNTEIPSCPA